MDSYLKSNYVFVIDAMDQTTIHFELVLAVKKL